MHVQQGRVLGQWLLLCKRGRVLAHRRAADRKPPDMLSQRTVLQHRCSVHVRVQVDHRRPGGTNPRKGYRQVISPPASAAQYWHCEREQSLRELQLPSAPHRAPRRSCSRVSGVLQTQWVGNAMPPPLHATVPRCFLASAIVGAAVVAHTRSDLGSLNLGFDQRGGSLFRAHMYICVSE